MKKYTDKKKADAVEYCVEDLVLLSTRDLKWQMVERQSEKLTKQFVELYKVKRIVLS